MALRSDVQFLVERVEIEQRVDAIRGLLDVSFEEGGVQRAQFEPKPVGEFFERIAGS